MRELKVPSGKWAVAFSGGADSVYLLLWAKEQNKDVIALHYNHKMREGASDADENFCKEFCALHKIPFFSASCQHELKNEEEARDARFAWFRSVHKHNPFTHLLTGHHANDVVETMLMRLTRSASTSGLCAPRPIQTMDGVPYTIARPLLHIPKKDIVESLQKRNVTWCEDHTNKENDFFRNRMRNIVIPKLEEVSGQNVVNSFVTTRGLLQEDDDALNAIAQSMYKSTAQGLDISQIRNSPMAIRRRVIQMWLLNNNLSLSRVSVDKLLESLTEKYQKHSCGKGMLTIQKGMLRYSEIAQNPEI